MVRDVSTIFLKVKRAMITYSVYTGKECSKVRTRDEEFGSVRERGNEVGVTW